MLKNEFELILFDPPFFYISLEQMSHALQWVGKHSTSRDMKLGMSFMTRDETHVKRAFGVFKLEKTNLDLEYATVKPNRWENYGWYQNTDLPMIKRLKKKN